MYIFLKGICSFQFSVGSDRYLFVNFENIKAPTFSLEKKNEKTSHVLGLSLVFWKWPYYSKHTTEAMQTSLKY